MTKKEFMIELESLLSRIPEDERKDAINYYEDYFADAGIEEHMLVPASVGTPAQVADKIIGETVYGESQKQEESTPMDAPVYYKETNNEKTDRKADTYYDGSDANAYKKKEEDNTKLIIGLVILIATAPIWFSVLMSIVGVLFGVLAALGGMVLGFGIAGIALIITSFMSGTIAAGALLMGIGILLLALAVALIVPFVLYCGKFLPWLIRECVKLVKKLFGRSKYHEKV